jgi:hypothetical protein
MQLWWQAGAASCTPVDSSPPTDPSSCLRKRGPGGTSWRGSLELTMPMLKRARHSPNDGPQASRPAPSTAKLPPLQSRNGPHNAECSLTWTGCSIRPRLDKRLSKVLARSRRQGPCPVGHWHCHVVGTALPKRLEALYDRPIHPVQPLHSGARSRGRRRASCNRNRLAPPLRAATNCRELQDAVGWAELQADKRRSALNQLLSSSARVHMRRAVGICSAGCCCSARAKPLGPVFRGRLALRHWQASSASQCSAVCSRSFKP